MELPLYYNFNHQCTEYAIYGVRNDKSSHAFGDSSKTSKKKREKKKITSGMLLTSYNLFLFFSFLSFEKKKG